MDPKSTSAVGEDEGSRRGRRWATKEAAGVIGDVAVDNEVGGEVGEKKKSAMNSDLSAIRAVGG